MKNTLNHHSLTIKYSFLSFQILLKQSCRAVVQKQLSGSDGRAPQGPWVCVPVLWDQGTARTTTLKTAGHSRSRLCLLCPLRPAVCREAPTEELILQNRAGLAVPWQPLCASSPSTSSSSLGMPSAVVFQNHQCSSCLLLWGGGEL